MGLGGGLPTWDLPVPVAPMTDISGCGGGLMVAGALTRLRRMFILQRSS